MGSRRLPYAGVAVLVALCLLVAGAGTASAVRHRAARSCAGLAALAPPHATAVTATLAGAGPSAPAHCAVRMVLGRFAIEVRLPAGGWNGRFQALGGSGFTGGASPDALNAALHDGYAVATTHTGQAAGSGSFALAATGGLDGPRVADFGHRGVHEMTVTAKSLVGTYYGRTSFRSYFNGCSTGGRQGLMEAQRYPGDYDGIAAASPAINWTRLHPAQLWGQVRMLTAGHRVAPCKLAAATAAAVAACDPADGLRDGITGDWAGCHFEARSLIGTVTGCGVVTAADAGLIDAIWDGPRDERNDRLWYGPERDASLEPLNGAEPFFITVDWLRYFVVQNPGWDWRTLTYPQYLALFRQSVERYRDVLATDEPDLSRFRDAGGKLVVWHGTADPVVMFRGSVDYFRRLTDATGGAERFARFFVAPGVSHCGGGPGAVPGGVLEAVVRWVERGVAPDRLTGTRPDGSTRPVCAYPLVAGYADGDFDCREPQRPRFRPLSHVEN